MPSFSKMPTTPNDPADAPAVSETKTSDERYFITALARGLEVLACFQPNDRSLSNQQIAERCGLPKSTVTRITATLTKLEYLMQLDESGGRYALGMATLALGSSMLSRMDIRQLARPFMQELADFSRSAVSIAVREGLSLIYIEVCRSSSALGLTLQVGSRIPLADSAIGRAYLAKASPEERSHILKRAHEVDASLYHALCHDLERGLRDYEEYGCTTSFGDWQKDINGIAVGLHPIGSSAALAINCGGPASYLSPEFLLNEVRPKLIAIAARFMP